MQIVIRDGKVRSWYEDTVEVDESQLPAGSELAWVPDGTPVKPETILDERGLPVDVVFQDDPRPNLPADYRTERDQLKAAIQSIADPTLKKILAYLARKVMKE